MLETDLLLGGKDVLIWQHSFSVPSEMQTKNVGDAGKGLGMLVMHLEGLLMLYL